MPPELLGPDGEPTSYTQNLAHELEEAVWSRRVSERNAEFLAYTVLNMLSGGEDDMRREDRLRLVRQSRDVWKRDPQAGRSANLLNDFCFGRGVQQPKCKDEAVQEVVEEAWEDPQNQRILTGALAQRRLGTDLSIQSNIFFLAFADGDGRMRLGLLRHDDVVNVVRDPENRHRVLYYVAHERKYEWDFQADAPKAVVPQSDPRAPGRARVVYYEHWQNVKEAEEEGRKFDRPPRDKLGEGKVFHVAINQTTEMAFGHPEFHRVIRWFTAFNEFMAARVDIIKANAQFFMKRRIKGGESTAQKIAHQTLSRRSQLQQSQSEEVAAGEMSSAVRPGSILNESDAVQHEALNLSTNGGNAQADGAMLLGQSAAGTGWPKPYIGGDPSSLAGATALELPVVKMVEARQEVFEQVFRWFIDRVIEEAVATGRISSKLTSQERAKTNAAAATQLAPSGAAPPPRTPASGQTPAPTGGLMEYSGESRDEESTERDLSYEFSMPQPLRRALPDLINSIATTAQAFDPNGTNTELSRLLFGLAAGEGFEVQDPGEWVEKVFPEGYQDPALAGFGGAPPGPNPFDPQPDQQANPYGGNGAGGFPPGGNTGADGQRHQEANPYGAPRKSLPPEQMQQAADQGGWPRGRNGNALSVGLIEAVARRSALETVNRQESPRAAPDGLPEGLESEYVQDVVQAALEEDARLAELDAAEPGAAGPTYP